MSLYSHPSPSLRQNPGKAIPARPGFAKPPQAKFRLRPNLALLAALFLAFGLALPICPQAPSPKSEIIAALRASRYDDALRLCSQALESDPKSPALWALRGVALEHTNRTREALAAYQQALQFAPAYLPALEGAAQIEYKTQSADALPLLKRILALQPNDATTHAMLGVLEYRQADYAAAAQDFRAAGTLPVTQPGALMAYALSLAHLNQFPQAIELLQQILTQNPEDAAARYDLALLQWRSSAAPSGTAASPAGDSDALATLQPLLDAKPPEARSMRLAAAIHEASHETPQAIELLRAAIAASPDDAANYVQFASLSFEHSSYSVGIDMVTLGLTRLPNAASLYMARGVLYGENGDFDKAMTDFDRAHRLDPANTLASSAEGIAESQQHNHHQALDDFRKQVREHPNDAFGYYLLAEALSWSGSDEQNTTHQKTTTEAIANAAKAIRLDAHLVQAYDLLGSLYLENDQIQPAIDTCRKALTLNPKDQQAVYTLMLALRKTGSKDELKDLVHKLATLREEQQSQSRQRYGRLLEAP